MSAAKDGVKRRTWSLEERQRIVAEALAPGASVAAVARRHGLNANLVFKWLRRSREGWLDRRRGPAKETAPAKMSPELAAQTFVPVELLELKPAPMSPALPPSSAPVAKIAATPARVSRKNVRRGAMEVSLPNGARLSLDADVDTEALRRVLSALGDL
ncbi:IS66-like element accessory protein TnpA [Methylocystis parvus]|nr:transposase [Methylocystis parvus]WBJ98833.1 transposase [Methylocystis parvus OBBP]WBK01287.1 transposase [Methylocystis parvus OBBP]WBK02329.1 transposase [Methylocystis parvus OBBP]WBK02434.1 transposase [Methylocystis parvus OBBP]